MNARTLHLVNLLLVAALLAASALAWPHLPERVPTHFDFAGNPTTWSRTSRLAWYGPPAVAAAVAVLVWLSARSARGNPWLWSVPEKDRFVRLSPERREPFVQELERIIAWTGVLVTIVFTALQATIYHTATRRADGLSPWLNAAGLLPIVVILVMAVRSSLRMAPRIRAAAEAEEAEEAEAARAR